MGLERRGNGLYYYKKRREGKKVVSVYQCGGRVAMIAAEWDHCDGLLRAQEKRDFAEETEAARTAEAAARQACEAIEAELNDFYTRMGYHFHRGEWRKRREQKAS